MFEFLKGITTRREKAATTARERYQQLIRQAATDGDLDAKATSEMDRLAVDLGFDTSAIARHVTAEREYQQLAKAAAGFEQTEAKLKAAHQPVKQFDADTLKLKAEHQRQLNHRDTVERQAVKVAYKAAVAAHEPARQARERIEALKSQHWDYFGGVSPADAATDAKLQQQAANRRRHLVRGIRGEVPEGLPIRVDVFESKLNGQPDAADVHYIHLEGQDADDFAFMVQTLASGGGQRVRYLRKRDSGLPALEYSACGIIDYFGDLMANAGNYRPGAVTYIAGPGQKQSDVDAMLKEIEAASAAHQGRGPVRSVYIGVPA